MLNRYNTGAGMPLAMGGLLLIVAAVLLWAGMVLAGEPPKPAPLPQALLAIRVAQVDALERLADLVLGAHLVADKTVGQAVGPGSDGDIEIRLLLRSARLAAEPRVYSDGLAEVDLECALDDVARLARDLRIVGAARTSGLADLEYRAIDGCLRASGTGRAPPDLALETAKRVQAARPEDVPEMFPLGWERVTATGRVAAIREARRRAYGAMAARIRDIHLGQTDKVGDLVGRGSSEALMLDVFIRSLPVAGEPRLMPDRLAEVDVAAPVRDVIRVLKDILALRGGGARATADDIDQLSVRLKVERLTVTGRGMPPVQEVGPPILRVAGGAPLPDWATEVLEARAAARFSDEVENREEGRVLAARSAKVRAVADLEKQVGAVTLADGRTVRQRSTKDEVFRRDVKTFLSGAKTTQYRPTEDGKGWEVTLRLPLIRLYEFSRPRE